LFNPEPTATEPRAWHTDPSSPPSPLAPG